MRGWSRYAVLVSLVVTVSAACGGGKGSPTGPSNTPTLTGLTLGPGTDLIKTRATETFIATATFSDGSAQVVQGAWSTDAPLVATVDTGGRVTGAGPGQATIIVDHQGLRATRLIRVVPDYHGRWTGDWAVATCGDSGDLRGFCDDLGAGTLVALTLVVNQTRDTMTGTTDFGDDLPGPVTGTIQMNGHLIVSGTYTITNEGLTLEFTVSNWDTFTSDNQRMTGQFRLSGRVAGIQGSFTLDGNLRVVAKTSSTPAAPALSLGEALGRFSPRP